MKSVLLQNRNSHTSSRMLLPLLSMSGQMLEADEWRGSSGEEEGIYEGPQASNISGLLLKWPPPDIVRLPLQSCGAVPVLLSIGGGHMTYGKGQADPA